VEAKQQKKAVQSESATAHGEKNEEVQNAIAAKKQNGQITLAQNAQGPQGSPQQTDKISYEYFSKMQIRIGRIINAEKAPNSDKLLKLDIDLGNERRQILAGIALTHRPEELIGKQIPVIANLEYRKMRGLESQGMILAIDIGSDCVLLHPAKDVPAGAKVM